MNGGQFRTHGPMKQFPIHTAQRRANKSVI